MELIEFAQKYCKYLTTGPENAHDFKVLEPFQIDFLESLLKHRFTLTTKTKRTLGVSSLLAIYGAWYLLFSNNPTSSLAIGSPTRAGSCIILQNTQNILDAFIAEYPYIEQVINNKSKKKLSTGNTLIGVSSSIDSLRGVTSQTIIIDDADKFNNISDIFPVFMCSLVPYGQFHLISGMNEQEFFKNLKSNENVFYKQVLFTA